MDTAQALARAVELGEQGLGTTHPNPSVGAVVLDAHGQVVGQGRTQPPGGAHAEVLALAQAGGAAVGGTAVITLEPCSHTGQTGPCTQALIAAGVARVVYAEIDPHQEAAGGAMALRAAGITVEQAGSAAYLHPWLTATRTGRPFVTWKTATTLDGRVAAPDGSSRWITGPEALEEVHALRSRVDAVVTGIGTVLADDPELTDRRPGATRQPHRVVLDRARRTPERARVHPATLMDRGVAATAAEQLAVLWEQGFRHVLLECGPTVAGDWLPFVDEVVAFIAPAHLGAGLPVVQTGAQSISELTRWELRSMDRIGHDVRLILGRP